MNFNKLLSRPILAAVIGAFIISSSGALTKLSLESPATIALWRCIWALPLLAFFSHRETLKFGKRVKRDRVLSGLAGIAFTFDLVMWHYSIRYIGAGMATVLGNLSSVVVAFVAWTFLKERPSNRLLIALPFVLLGVTMTTGVLGGGADGINPGLGVGGHCIPIDPIYLAQKAESVGASAQFIRQANLVNQQMPLYVLKRLEGLLGGGISGKKICIVGISYKPDVTDMRQSPSIILWQELEKKGAQISFHDEIVKEFKGKISTALRPNSFDLVVVAVTHSNLEVDKVINSAPIIFDCTGTIKGAHQL